jgi:hypothetical protein
MSDNFFMHYAKYFILLCALVGFFYSNKLKYFKVLSLPYFLITVFIGECVGTYLKSIGYFTTTSNLFIYFLLPYQILYYLWLIGTKVLEKPKIAYSLISLFLLVFVIELIVGKNNPSYIFTKSFGLGGVLLSIMFLLFILKISKDDKVIKFYQNIYFWICIGVALYYTLSFPFYTYYNTLLIKYKDVFFVYRNIIMHFSVSMYLFFIIGFIWSKKI